MSDDYIETEAKFLVSDLESIRKQLEECGAVLVHPRTYERNIRYENANGTFTDNGVVLRLRQDNRVRLTYKEPVSQTEKGISQRFEAEVEVSDLATMDVILQKLGFRPFRIYEKYRATYIYLDAEIVLDEMPYGYFVEIEGASDVIHQVLYDLGWAAFPRFVETYLELFDRVKRVLDLQVDDLTFENFEGVMVPSSAFESEDPA